MVIPAQISTDIRWIGRDSWGLQGAARPGATAASLAASGSPSACYLTVEWMALAGRVPHGEGAAEWPDPMVAGTRAGPAPVLGADAGPPRVRPRLRSHHVTALTTPQLMHTIHIWLLGIDGAR